jgi:hypothetical protein
MCCRWQVPSYLNPLLLDLLPACLPAAGDFELAEELLALLATGHMHPGLQAWLCGTLGEPGLRRLARWVAGATAGQARLRGLVLAGWEAWCRHRCAACSG